MKVSLSNRAEYKLLQISNYLLENWSLQSKNDFIKNLYEKVEQIKKYPYSCIESFEYKGLYKCVVSKQTTFYYRVLKDKDEIEIISVFDTRQNPDKLNRDL
ncbi:MULTISPECIES: type II toxin-antitoxin system RelE/ParE family toxin [unclassified Polaribacter]|uniref:type II toxin-antitoxin system RelE/ParE family toxin n=1 Tax=unclassified Polaribacter TaxID=196858 RepID=UPI0011BF87EE|nr:MULTISPECIES: type II toxin-antitoxin system RelE/ParE family toxin [unclassified Polaribacter]TXD52501.1 type II toxin-antitoxin system RelE/ParE family toxin [Polaribacter sp. IC063]TXD60487.1 type II toxin-antitoxin system RelE/ParE family toxin [Polaribacter sp. IC066]